ncbi:MAG: FHA domain-containing protein [Anaerolineae bacterium]|nr:FHA domain-containing protein [Anaerolineae bacterium]
MESSRQYLLIVVEGPNAGETYVLQHALCTIGRTPENAIVIDSPRISRHHAQLKPTSNSLAIEDLNSTNGTWVNGKRLTASQILVHGDEIELADHVTLRFEIEETMRTERLAPSAPFVATQAMAPAYGAQLPTPPPGGGPSSAPAYIGAAPAAASTDATPSWLTGGNGASAPTASRPKWMYVLIVILVILILLCLVTAIYLWFAPTEVWIRIFEIFNIPLP